MGKTGRACAGICSLTKSGLLVLSFSNVNCHYSYVSLLRQKEREKLMCMFDIVWTECLGRRSEALEEKMFLYSSGAGFVASERKAFTNGFPGGENSSG